MKKYCFFLLLTICWMSCQDDTDSASDNTTVEETTTTPDAPVHIKASDIAPFIGMWHYSVGISNDPGRKADYEGRWIQFDKEGGFTSGKYDKQTNSGTYSYDSDQQFLNLNYQDDADRDIDWGIQQGVDVMIWKGNAQLNQTGDQIRMQKMTGYPQR